MTAYYGYLPAIFIWDEIKITSYPPTPVPPEFIWMNSNTSGVYYFKMSGGVAMLLLPFFLIGHMLANLLNYPVDGFSTPYTLMVWLAAIFYTFLALLVLRKLLLKHFSDTTTAITLTLLGAGTNLYHYVTGEAAMAHVYAFFTLSIALGSFVRWTERKEFIWLCLSGVFCGWTTLIRPTDIILCAAIPMYGLFTFFTPEEYWQHIKHYPAHWVAGIFGFILAWLPQMIYWKYVTGSLLYYSYNDESFFFSNSHVIDGLISFRKGWLIYTPVMILALTGIPILFKKQHPLSWPIFLTIPAFIFITFSWWCWWYGGSMGQRPMIDAYPLLAFALAASVECMINLRWVKFFSMPLIAGLIYLNIYQSMQYRKGILHYDSMTFDVYKEIFLKMEYPRNYDQMILHPDYDNAKKHGE